MTSNLSRSGLIVVCASTAILALAGGAASWAEQSVPNPVQSFSQNRKDPMHIEAQRLEVRDKEKIATFSGNVQVVQGDTTLKCKVLVVHYEQRNAPGAAKSATPGPQNSQQIRRLEAKGSVIVTQKDQIATGDNGTFDVATNTVTLFGNVVINQGPNVTRGERVVVNLTTGVSRVEAGTGPVKMMIQQNPKKDAQPAETPKGMPRLFGR